MYEVVDKIYVASTIKEDANGASEIIHVSDQPLFERQSVFIPIKKTDEPPLFNCMKKNAPEMYKCEICGFEMYLKANLKIHMEMVHRLDNPIPVKDFFKFSNENYNMSKILKQYYCEKCEFATHALLVLFQHKSIQHEFEEENLLTKLPKTLTELTQLEKSDVKSEDYNIQLNCDQCLYVTKCKYQLKKHIQANHPLSEDDQLYECGQCSFKTVHLRGFESHKLNHDKKRHLDMYKCTCCFYTTKSKHLLKSHVLFKHTAEEEVPKFKCNYCPYWAKQKGSLKQHILARHTSEEQINWFFCEMCPFKSKTKTHLRVHMSKHSEEKLVLCEMCSVRFKYKGSLRKHMVRKHEIDM